MPACFIFGIVFAQNACNAKITDSEADAVHGPICQVSVRFV